MPEAERGQPAASQPAVTACKLTPSPTYPSYLQVYPCRLSVIVLPAQQVLEAATLVDCARRLCSVYGAPWHIRFKLQVRGSIIQPSWLSQVGCVLLGLL